MRNGRGTFNWADGDKYEGEYKDNKNSINGINNSNKINEDSKER